MTYSNRFKFSIGSLLRALFLYFRILRDKKSQTLGDILNTDLITFITLSCVSVFSYCSYLKLFD